ncbi:hypothetical protein PITC_000580 [Penicillium italicum]|uniref:AB hydrolase-1 domain-containing protein n=1 Tax=Penicillium italicum TaxID=40296 RepID=A0A0A2KTP2_PENIT|nr:hypothetical protein PITC_000580 [Penicillium italicum]
MPVDKIRVSGDSRIEYKTATLNGHNYSYVLSQPKSGQFKATVFLLPTALDTDEQGAGLAYRIALWHPELVSHLFTVCVPYAPPMAENVSLEDFVRDKAPNFTYQLQFKSGELEKVIRSKDDIRQFLLALYGGRTEAGELGIDTTKGVLLDKFGGLKLSRLLSEEELEFYTNEFARHGIHGPLNWYRTRDLNYEDELAILDRHIQVPTLFVQALRDQALPPHLGKSMPKQFPRLTVKQVDTSHWALWEKPEEVNEIIRSWLADQSVAGGSFGKL